MLNRTSEQDFPSKTHRSRRLARERYPEAHIPSHGADDRQRRPTTPNLPAFLRLNHGRRGHPARQSHAFRKGEIRTGAPFFTRVYIPHGPLIFRSQNMAKPPTSLPPSGAAPLHVSLLLGSFVHSPATLDLFDLHIPPSAPAPVHPDEQIYHPRPELAHTFRPDPKLPPRIISAFFTALVVAPWVVLLGLVCVSFVQPGAFVYR